MNPLNSMSLCGEPIRSHWSIQVVDSKISIVKNESGIVEISSFGRHAAGQAEMSGSRFSVPGALPGETVRISVLPGEGNRNCSRLEEIIDPSPIRTDPECDQAGFCPGCRLRHMRYPMQLEWFRTRHEMLLARENITETSIVEPVQAHPSINTYRIRVTARVMVSENRYMLGMKSYPGWTQQVDLTRCPNHVPELNGILTGIQHILNEQVSGPIKPEHLKWVLIHLSSDQRHRITFVVDSADWFLKSVLPQTLKYHFQSCSLHLVESAGSSQITVTSEPLILHGAKEIRYPFFDMQLSAYPGAWTPVSYGTSEQLAETLLQLIQEGSEGKSVVEVGCGIGGVTLFLARKGYDIAGIDQSRAAIHSAEINRERMGCDGVVFRCGRAGHGLRRLLAGQFKANTVILHGMRKAFDSKTIDAVRACGASRLILVSPGTGSFMRNIKDLQVHAWKLDRIQLHDQIPHTTSVLSVGVFSRIR
jgi:23S rRNA (uracil1939-C5)-methyltransferase